MKNVVVMFLLVPYIQIVLPEVTSFKLLAETMLQVNNAFARMDMVVISSGREHCGMVEKVGKKSAKASLANDARFALIG
jgi:hypothetical protein